MVKSNTNQQKCYTHLSLAEREEITIALERGQSIRSIALSLARSSSSVSREIKWNLPPLHKVKYRGNRAQKRVEDRSRHCHAKERLPHPQVKACVEYHLTHDRWSPESIAGRLPLDFPELKTNHESIYLWIYKEYTALLAQWIICLKERRVSYHTWSEAIKNGIQDTSPR